RRTAGSGSSVRFLARLYGLARTTVAATRYMRPRPVVASRCSRPQVARTGRPTRWREAFALAERATTPRDRILTLEQVRCATRPRLRGVSDLDADDHELLDSNVRSFEFRKTLGVIAYIPRLVLFDDPW